MGIRKAQVLHTRLRTNCSSLNLDLFLRNISDSPLCRCGSVENAQHYFFHCRYYQVQRIELLNSVLQYQTPSLSLLLHGNDSFSLGTNTVIFEKVHKFIMDSKRYPVESKRLVLSLSVLEIFVFDATVSANPHPSSIFSSMVCKSLFSFFFWISLSLFLSLCSF